MTDAMQPAAELRCVAAFAAAAAAAACQPSPNDGAALSLSLRSSERRVFRALRFDVKRTSLKVEEAEDLGRLLALRREIGHWARSVHPPDRICQLKRVIKKLENFSFE